jgi:hypothetical protein
MNGNRHATFFFRVVYEAIRTAATNLIMHSIPTPYVIWAGIVKANIHIIVLPSLGKL